MNNKKKIRIIFAVFSIILLSLNYCFSQDTTIIYTKNVYPYFQSGNAYFEKNAKIFPSKPGPFVIYTEVKYLDTTIQFKWLQGELAPGGMTGKWTCWHLNGIKSWEASFFKNTRTSKEYFTPQVERSLANMNG